MRGNEGGLEASKLVNSAVPPRLEAWPARCGGAMPCWVKKIGMGAKDNRALGPGCGPSSRAYLTVQEKEKAREEGFTHFIFAPP